MWLRPMAVPSETAEDGPSVEGLDCSRVLTDVIKRHQDSHQGTAQGSRTQFCPGAHGLWREEPPSLYQPCSAAHPAKFAAALT